MLVHVKNIRINDNQPYDLDLPLVYAEYGPLAKIFVRTHMFQCHDVEYDYEIIKQGVYKVMNTEHEKDQPNYVDIVDCHKVYNNQYVKVKVTPMPQVAMLVWLSQEEIQDYRDVTDSEEEVIGWVDCTISVPGWLQVRHPCYF